MIHTGWYFKFCLIVPQEAIKVAVAVQVAGMVKRTAHVVHLYAIVLTLFSKILYRQLFHKNVFQEVQEIKRKNMKIWKIDSRMYTNQLSALLEKVPGNTGLHLWMYLQKTINYSFIIF